MYTIRVKAIDGSSSINNFGFFISAIAMPKRCFIPSEKSLTFFCLSTFSLTFFNTCGILSKGIFSFKATILDYHKHLDGYKWAGTLLTSQYLINHF